ncbi:MAG TPA: hypothetical protein VEA78_13355, partial [Acidimicrobiales bacterium]|nr:hypothetical protein [Acidimicrobiales bacterium]
MDRRLAVGLGVGAGAALLVAGVGSAGLVGLSGTPAGVVVTSTPTPLQSPPSAGPTPTPRRVDPVPADVLLAETVLDPAALPVRRPDRAAVVVQAYDSTGDIALLAFDADEAEWVRVELPGRSRLGQIRLSPDGRAILRPVDRPSAPGAIEVVDLATGVTRPVPVPVPQGRVAEDCWGDAAWASSGRVGIVSGCLVPTTATGAGPAYVGMDTWVHEVDLATGGARVVEHVADSA